MRFFKPNVHWDKAWKEYEAHLRSISDSLPDNARRLASLSFHDSNVKAVNHLSKEAVEIVIEGYGFDLFEKKGPGYGTYTLSFSGAKKIWVPYSIVGLVWLCEEMRLSDVAAFDYEVALSEGSIRIQADDVLLIHGVCK